MVVGFTTTYTIGAYHHWCEFESWSGFSPGTSVSCTNKADRHDIAEILLKVELNTIKPNQAKIAVAKCLFI